MNDKEIADAWEVLRHTTSGRDIAEMEIEARKEARTEPNCPYPAGSFEALVFWHERSKHHPLYEEHNHGI